MKRSLCPLCNSREFKILYRSTLTPKDYNLKAVSKNLLNTLDNSRKHGQYVKCLKCTLLYVNPPEKQELLNSGYRKVIDEMYLETEKFREVLSQKHFNEIKKFKKKGNLLDVGCFTGIFLNIAKKNGFKVEGIEPSSWARKIVKEKEIPIIGTELSKSKLTTSSYDVITLWDVIEHLPNPNETVALIARSLKKRGIVAIGTPDAGSLAAKLMGKHFPYLVRMHVILFSRRTLKNLLEKHGLKVIYSKSYGRTFPISYIINRLPINKRLCDKLQLVIKYSFLKNVILTVNLGDSFLMIAKKNE